MERGDYFEAKAAILNMRAVQAEAEVRAVRATLAVERIMQRIGLPVGPGYQFDDATLTITPTPPTGGA